MKLRFNMALIAVALLMSNCSQEETLNQVKGSTNTLTATIESTSRSAVTDKGVFSWSAGDKISVYNGLAFTEFAYSGNGNSFTGETITPTGVAVYPAGNHKYEGTKTTVNLPSSYNFGSTNAPMVAEINSSSLTFKHVGGLMRFIVEGMPSGANKFTFTANSGITGDFEVNEGTIVAKESGDKTVTINFTEEQYDAESMTFYIPLPTGSYAGYTVSIGDETNMSNVTATEIVNKIDRATLLLMPTFTYDVEKGLQKKSSKSVAVEAGEQTLAVNGSQDLEIEVPASMEEGVEAVLNLNYTPSDETSTLTLSENGDETESQDESVATINVSVPDESTVAQLNVNAPSMTVELTVKDGETATYNVVTALTAQNTLMIGKGVSVADLKIKGGHVRLGGSITGTITREDGNGDSVTYIILEEGAKLPENFTVPENVKVVNAAEYELIAKFRLGGTQTITLDKDIELAHPLTLKDESANITVDLGTFSLTNKTAYDYDNCGATECYVFEVQAGTLNIKGTTGSVNAIGGSDYDMAVFANNNGKVTISGGKFTNLGKENNGCDLVYARDNAVITISGGEFEAGNKSSDVGNQYVALNLKDNSGASIIVTGGKFHKFNPAYNVSENPKKSFAGNNTMVAVSGTEGNEVYEVIDLSSGYTLTSDIEIATPITISTTESIEFNLGTYSLTNKTAYDYDNCGATECYVFEVQAGTFNIKGTTGSVNAIGGSDYDMAVFANNNGKVTISGGKFTNLGKENNGCDLVYARDNAVITISGGEFEAGNKSSDVGNQYVALNLKDNSGASIIVTGGKFHKFNPAYNVSENPKKSFAGNNTMVAVSGTEGNEVYEVIDLSSGYTLTSDIEIATPITISTTESIEFNLGTYSLTNKTAYDYDNCGETECYVFEVQAGTLNINGSGSVKAIGGSAYDMVVFANNSGKVVINGGEYKNGGQVDKGCDVIYAKNAAVVEIYGGTFEAGNANKESFADKTNGVYAALNLHGSATGAINVYGGTFVKFDPANPGTESASWNETHTNGFVATGYTSVRNGDNYVVVKK